MKHRLSLFMAVGIAGWRGVARRGAAERRGAPWTQSKFVT